jgi:hypothetical protein
MELGKQQYQNIIEMPVKIFHDYIKWKSDVENEKAKILKNEAS